MAKREWGPICPEDGGLLLGRPEWDAQGVYWCPSAEHGGNGRFWRKNEVTEGWSDPTRSTPSEAYLARQREAAERTASWHAELEAHRKEKARMAKTPTTKATPKAKEPRDCLCGCGGQTKGGRFIPGHDARFHSRVRALEAQGVSHDEAAKIASKGPLTGKYAKAAEAARSAKAPKATNGAEAPEPIRTRPARKPKGPDLTARATDEPADEPAPVEDISI